ATAAPDGAGLVAGAGATGALLVPRLRTGTAHGGLRFHARGAAAAVCAIGNHGVMHRLGVLAVGDDLDIRGLRGLGCQNCRAHLDFLAACLAACFAASLMASGFNVLTFFAGRMTT